MRHSSWKFFLPKRVIRLWRMMDVWHKSIRQRPQDVARTLIACDTRHRRAHRDIVHRQHGRRRWVAVVRRIVGRSNVAHLILT
jgi:hypothetical protein